MQIMSVGYSRLVNTGNYENEKLSAWANVPEGADPVEVKNELETWVRTQLGATNEAKSELEDLQDRAAEIRYKITQYQDAYNRAKSAWQEAKAFAKKLGLRMSLPYISEGENLFPEETAKEDATHEEVDSIPF